jgi:hypothetical protein
MSFPASYGSPEIQTIAAWHDALNNGDVEQGAQWQSTEPGDRQTVASVFVVRDDLATSVVRFPDLASALRAANLDESHERSSG